MEPYGVTFFCDDIRFEQQNKMTLIGCYGPEMLIYQEPPITLPKLGIVVQARFPLGQLPGINVKMYMPGQDEPFHTQELSKAEETYQPTEEFDPNPTDPAGLIGQRGMAYPFLFSPFTIPAVGYLRVRLAFNSEVLRVGALKVTQVQLPQITGTAMTSPSVQPNG